MTHDKCIKKLKTRLLKTYHPIDISEENGALHIFLGDGQMCTEYIISREDIDDICETRKAENRPYGLYCDSDEEAIEYYFSTCLSRTLDYLWCKLIKKND